MMAATALVGCGGSGDSSTASKTESNGNGASATSSDFGDEDNITLKVWAPFEKECEAFKALYPDKKIDITVVAQTEKDAATNLLNDASAAADVFGFASDQLNKLQTAGVIAQAAYADDISKRDTAESVSAATLDGKIYAYPETGDNGYYLVYDKSVVSVRPEVRSSS